MEYPKISGFRYFIQTSIVLGIQEAAYSSQVEAFHAKALELGGQSDGAPGLRELYGPQYYGAFVRDLDGHKIEAMFWDESAG